MGHSDQDLDPVIQNTGWNPYHKTIIFLTTLMIKGKGFFEIGGNFGLEKYPPGDKIFNPLLEPYSDH